MRASLSAALVVLTVGLACRAEPEAKPEPSPGGPYLSVLTGDAERPRRLVVFDLGPKGGAQHPKVAELLTSEAGGWVLRAHGGSSPSGRYGLYLRTRDYDGSFDEPWKFELHLVDFVRSPLDTRRLSIPAWDASAGWSEDERLMWIAADFFGQESLWTLALGDAERQPAMRIPIEAPQGSSVYGARFSPGARWLYYMVPGVGRLFAVRFEDRRPVEQLELVSPPAPGLDEPLWSILGPLLWVDDEGRGLSRAWEPGGEVLVSFDLERGAEARAVPLAGPPAFGWTLGPEPTNEGAGEPQWVLRHEWADDFVQPLPPSWVALEWGDSGPSATAAVEIEATLPYGASESDHVIIGEELYFIGRTLDDPPREGLLRVRAGESEVDEVHLVPSVDVIWGLATNRAHTLLAVHSPSFGVIVFEPGADGPGAAHLASPAGYGQWGLYGDRFVQAHSSVAANFVRVVDFAETPPVAWDLPGVAPLAALPSPVDSRVFILDDNRLWVEDPLAAGSRTQLELSGDPTEATGTDTGEAGDTGPQDPATIEHIWEAVVHAPPVASYAAQ